MGTLAEMRASLSVSATASMSLMSPPGEGTVRGIAPSLAHLQPTPRTGFGSSAAAEAGWRDSASVVASRSDGPSLAKRCKADLASNAASGGTTT